MKVRTFLAFAYSRKTMERVFDPVLADMQEEWQRAMVTGAEWKASWVRVRGHYTLAKTAGLQSVVALAKQAAGLWKAL